MRAVDTPMRLLQIFHDAVGPDTGALRVVPCASPPPQPLRPGSALGPRSEHMGAERPAAAARRGSHMEPLHSSLREGRQAPESDDQAERSGDRDNGVLIHGQKLPDVPCHICSSEPGDVVAFDMRACEPNGVPAGREGKPARFG